MNCRLDGEAYAVTADSSLESPAAIDIQNCCRSTRRPAGGRPGERTLARPDKSDCRLRIIAISIVEVLQRPIESTQYTSYAFGKRCREMNVMPSMGSVGDAFDNAMAESFFATLERELLNRRRFKTQAEAKLAVFEWIEGWYNLHRRHSSLGRISPVTFERRQTNSKAA